MKHTKSRLLSLVLAIGMIVSLFPSTALAAVAKTDVAKIGDNGYTTLAAAVEAATDGQTITLLADATGVGVVVPSGKNFTLDFGGYTYTVDTPVGSSGTVSNGLQLLKGSTLIFKNGKISSSGSEVLTLVQNYCNLTLENVTLDGSNLPGTGRYTLSNNCGNVQIKGKTNIIAKEGNVAFDLWYGMYDVYAEGIGVTFDNAFIGTVTGVIEYGRDATAVNPSTGTWQNATALVINAGTFNSTFRAGSTGALTGANITVTGGKFTSDPKDYLAAGKVATLANSVYTVGDPVPVAMIGTTGYDTLAAAVDAVADGATITLGADVTLTAPVDIDKTVTLDLAGKKITPVADMTGDYLLGVKYGGTLTINDSSSEKTGAIDANSVETVYGAVKMTLTNETYGDKGAVLVVNGGLLKGYYFGVSGNGNRHHTDITINGGTLCGYAAGDNLGMYHPQSGKLTINGGSITGVTGLAMKSGQLTITGGTIEGTGAKAAYVHAGSGFNSTGDGLVVEACDYPGQPPVVVNISGGTFISANNQAIAYYQQSAAYALTNTQFISGGKFSDASWLPYVADTATIKLANDVAGPGIVTEAGDNLTLDLNGHTYTINSPVGSTGTVTNGMQLLKGSTVKIMNGTIAAATDAGVRIGLKNYANLTLENVHINGENISLNTVSNCGQLVINGENTVIEKPAGGNWAVLTGNYEHGDVITANINAGTIDSVAIETPLWEIGGATVDESVTTTINGGVIGTVGKYDWRPAYPGYENAPVLTNAQLIITGGSFTDLANAVEYVADNATIKLADDVTGNGVIVPSGKNFTLDFDSHTYTVNANNAGSAGTKTQCFQLLKNSTLIFKSGTIKAGGANLGMIVQNYANLTLDGMTLDGTDLNSATWYYTLSNNSGTVAIKDTTIKAKAGGVAFDSCKSGNYATPNVTVSGDSVITGQIEVTGGNLTVNGGAFSDLSGLSYVAAGKTYTLGTSYTLPFGKSATVPAKVKLLVPAGVTLTNNGAFTNEGAITVVGTLKGNEVTGTGTVNGNAPVVEAPKPAEVVEVVSTIDPTDKAAVTENKAVIEAAVAAITAVNNSELKTNAMIEDLGKLEDLYVAANNITVTQPTVSGIANVTSVAVDNAALSVPTDAQTKTAAVTVAPVTLETAQKNAVDAVVTAADNATVIPLEITLEVAGTKTQPVAPLAFKIQVDVNEATAKKMVIAHVKGDGVEVIIPTVTTDANSVFLEFVATSLSAYVVIETPNEQNPNAYTVTFTPTADTAATGGTVSYDVYVNQDSGASPITGLDLILDFNAHLSNPALTSAGGSAVTLNQISEFDEIAELRNKWKLQFSDQNNPWTPTANQLIGRLTFDVANGATGTAGNINVNATYSGISNSNYDESARVTLDTTTDVRFVVGYVEITLGETTYYAKYNNGATLYTDTACTDGLTIPVPTAATGRLLDTTNWYLADQETTLASFRQFTSAQTFIGKTTPEYGITLGANATAGAGIIGGKVAKGIDASFTIAEPSTGMTVAVSYTVVGATGTGMTNDGLVYTIPGENITGAVTVTVEYSLDLTADDIGIFTETTGVVDAYKIFSAYSGTRTLVLIKDTRATGLTLGANSPTIYATDAYTGYKYAVLIDSTGVTVSAAGMLEKLNALGIAINETANESLIYNWNTNGKAGGRIVDVQATYDFMSLASTAFRWTPSDKLLLIADVMTIGQDGGLNNNDPASYTVARDGKLTPADVNAFLYRYAQF